MNPWGIYIPVFFGLFLLDLLINRGEISVKRSLIMTGFYMATALLFSFEIYRVKGADAVPEYITIYFLEQMLSVDNLLVISMIFSFFMINKAEQHKALLYGIIGAVVFRVLAIAGGTQLIHQFEWVLYCFALLLIYSGVKIVKSNGDDDSFNPGDKWFVRKLRSKFGQAGAFVGAIIAIELCDIMFAIDSIPASFSVSQDSFVILTANLFAVLGLRSLYHAVAAGLKVLHGMEKYIGVVLILLGVEVFVHHLVYDLPEWVTMAAVMGTLGTGVFMSRRKVAVTI